MNRIALILASLAVSTVAPAAHAASQGEMGETSTGSIAISLSVAKRVQIGGLSDVTFAMQSPEADAVAAQSVCVWSNTATGGYSVTATGSGSGSGFTLANGQSSASYNVTWSDSAGQGAGTPLAVGAPLTGQTSDASSPDCTSGAAASASLIVSIPANELQGTKAEVPYQGTLNLLVSPE